MGYLIGQLGGLLPIPGGLGGIDGGLIGTLIVFGTPAAVTAAAVIVYRVILFWLPLLAGAVAFISLRRGLNRPDRPELCWVPSATCHTGAYRAHTARVGSRTLKDTSSTIQVVALVALIADRRSAVARRKQQHRRTT